MIKEALFQPNKVKEGDLFQKEFSEIPEGYVSVFHEANDLNDIGKEGLKTLDQTIDKIYDDPQDKEKKAWLARNADEVRPENLKQAGISRFNIFAYPANSKTADGSYFSRGNTLEVLVDPNKCYVLEMDKYGRAWDDLNQELSKITRQVAATYNNDLDLIEKNSLEFKRKIAEAKAAVNQTEIFKQACIDNGYWNSAVTLADFNKYYKKSNFGFEKYATAPDYLPPKFSEPEVLIPEDVPPGRIRVVEDKH
jgi:hypothetical protein